MTETVRLNPDGRKSDQMSDKPQFWFNIKTKMVEKGLKSSSLDRVGPFDSEQEALNAEQVIKQRSETWREEEESEE